MVASAWHKVSKLSIQDNVEVRWQFLNNNDDFLFCFFWNRNCSLVWVIFRHVLSKQWWQMVHENGTGICCPFLKQGSQLNNVLVKVQVVGLGPKEFPVWPCHPVVHQCQGKDIHGNRITLSIVEDTFQLLVPISHVDGEELDYILSVEVQGRSCFKEIVESIALEACHKWWLTAHGAVGQPGIRHPFFSSPPGPSTSHAIRI